MSPLLGSSGGSSEYAFRGTLDDWPVDFSAALTLQNLTGIDPTSVGIATLNITGLNYKVRVTSESDVSSVRAVHEVDTNVGFGTTAVTDGRQIFSRRKESDPALLVRDQSKIELLLTPIVGFKTSFSKTYDIPLKVGKRSGNWRVTTRDIDQSPTPFGFTPRVNVELGITTVSGPVTISGLEDGFDFDIAVIANPSLDPGIPAANVKLFKNGIEIVGGIGTVSNVDQIYLSTISPNRYATPRTFTVQVGTYSTDWSILTRDAVTTVNPFGFAGISSANQLGFGYTSTYMDVLGADPGIEIPVSMAGGFFQIFKSDGTLRYPGANPLLPSWQNTSTFAFNTDRINVKVDSSGSYNRTTSGTLTVSNQTGTFNVTTRPTPVDTIPNSIANLFTDVSSPPGVERSTQITSNSIAIVGMTTGASDFASASISASPTGLIAQFEVQRPGSGIVKPFDNVTTFNVRNDDIITLKLTTPNDPLNNGISNSLFTLNINGTSNTTNTITPLNNPEGYIVSTETVFDTWSVTTRARQCEVSPFVLTAASGVIRGTDVSKSFTVQGFDSDCQMFVMANSSSTSPLYQFTSLVLPNGTVQTLPPNTTSIPNVSVGSTVNLTARASSSILPASVNVIIDVSNADSGNLVTPKTNGGLGFSTSWTINSVGDTSPSSITLSGPTGAVTTGQSFTLNWTAVNCLSIRSITGPSGLITPVPTTSVPTGSITLTAPVVGAGLLSEVFTYTIVSDMNPAASNYTAAGISNTVSVTVDQDFVPADPGNFTNLDPVTPGSPLTPRFFRSTVLTITGISTQLTAVVRTPTSNGSDGILTVNTPGLTGEQPSTSVQSSKTIKPNDSIQLQLAAAPADGPTGYLTTTTVTVDFKDPLNVVRLTKSFSVKTSACQRQTKQVTFGDAANSVTLEYDVGAIYTNRATGSQVSADLLKGSVSSIGSATGYYAVAPNTGLFINGTPLTWQTLVNQTISGFTTTAQRPPTDTEILSIFNSINPNTLVSISGLIPPTLRSTIVTFASGVANRDTTTAILDTPCQANIIAPGVVYV